MATTRRSFLQSSLAAGAAVGLAGAAGAMTRNWQDGSVKPADRKLKILILGGTAYLGPETVEYALARGHEVTLFNRGRTNPHLFPDLEKLEGDRDPNRGAGLEALKGRRWDCVVDTSGYVPRIVKASAELLGPAVQHYLFVSSISVYGTMRKVGINEDDPVDTMEDPTNEEVGRYYGPLKALCEQAAEEVMPGRAISVRPGLIVGPGDPTDRFTYWPVRIDRGGEVLAPGNPHDPVQYIDVRDLAEFMVHALEQRIAGTYNVNGPAAPTNIAEVLYGCKAVSGSDAQFTWANAEFLAANQVAPWQHMPLWIPPAEGYEGFHQVDCSRAIAAGLTFRPLADTVAATLKWHKANRPADYQFGVPDERGRTRPGLSADREAELLKRWHNRANTGGESE